MSLDGRGGFDTPPDLHVALIAAQQHGRVRFDQLVACGIDDAAVARRVMKGQLHRVHTGVYAVGHPGESLHAQFMAAVLAGGDGAVLSHWAAATLYGLVRWDGRRIDVTVRGGWPSSKRDPLSPHALAGPVRHDTSSRHPGRRTGPGPA